MNKDTKLTGMIDNLNKKIKDLYKYKNFVDLNRNTKKLYERFEKIQTDNHRLVQHIKQEKTNFELLQRENLELKKVLKNLKNDGLSYENKKKFYEIKTKNNEINEKNEELKTIIKNKENKIIEINNEMIKYKEDNENIKIVINNFTSNVANFINSEQEEKKDENKEEEKDKNVSQTEERGSHRKEEEDAELEEEIETKEEEKNLN